MSALVVGMSHRSAPVALLECLSLDGAMCDGTVRQLVSRPSLSEAMIVSTCNRLEVYAVTNSFHAGVRDVVQQLSDVSGVDVETLRGYLYVRYADAAAEHVMQVAAGLDSMVVGEQQIIGQVRSAYEQATEQGTVGQRLHSLSQAALRAGKRVHAETDIDDEGASMVSFAIETALRKMGAQDLRGRRALILGAGAMASLAATDLGRRDIDSLIVANRTAERAERLAQHSIEAGVPASTWDYERRAEALTEVDFVVSATGTDGFTITAQDLPSGAELTLVDLSLPRDIEDAAGRIEGVNLVNIESLREESQDMSGPTPGQVMARQIIAEELEAYSTAQRVRDVAPAVTALRRAAADIASTELDRLRTRLSDVDTESFAEVERTVRRVVDKLLHEPTVQAKRLAAESGSLTYETALQRLFGLDTNERHAVSVDVKRLPEAEVAVPHISCPVEGPSR